MKRTELRRFTPLTRSGFERGLSDLDRADAAFRRSVRRERCWAAELGRCWGGLEVAHIQRRSLRALRWRVENVRVMCTGHHEHFTANPRAWEAYCRGRGVDWDALYWRARNEAPERPTDVIARLRKEREA